MMREIDPVKPSRVALGVRLRALRTEANLGLVALEAKCHLGRSALSALERGDYVRPPSWDKVAVFVTCCLAQMNVAGAAGEQRLAVFRKLVDQVEVAYSSMGTSPDRIVAQYSDGNAIENYLRHMSEACRNLDHSFLTEAVTAPRSLGDYFVEPHLIPLDSARDPVLASSVVEHPGIYAVIGELGTGKSTLLQYLAWRAAEPARNRKRRVPFMISLGRISLADLDAEGQLFPVAYICSEAAAAGLSLKAETLNLLLESGRCQFLFDGLDEADLAVAPKLMERLKSTAIALRGRYVGNQMVVTSRPGQRALDNLEAQTFALDGFTWADVEHFAHKWDRGRQSGQSPIPDRSRVLLSVAHPRFRRLMTRPLFLTIVALLHDGTRTLEIEQRDEVFKMLSDRVLLRDADKGLTHQTGNAPVRSRRERLSHIALLLHGAADQTGDFRIASESLLDNLIGYLTNVEELRRGEAIAQAQDFIDWCVHAGLLILSNGTYAFRHLAMQQYFASAGLQSLALDSSDFTSAVADIIVTHCHNPHWAETVLFLASRLGKLQAGIAVMAVLTTAVGYGHLTRRNVLAASRILAECHVVPRDVQDECLQALFAEIRGQTQEHRLSRSWRRVYRESVSLLPTMRGTRAEYEIVTWLLAQLHADSAADRARSCELLGTLATSDIRAIDALFNCMRANEEPTVQDNARRALAMIARFQNSVVARLETMAYDPQSESAARQHACRALLNLHRGYAATLLVGLANDSHSKGRRLCSDWLRAANDGAKDPFSTWNAELPTIKEVLAHVRATGDAPARKLAERLQNDINRDRFWTETAHRRPAPGAAPPPATTEQRQQMRYVGDIIHVFPKHRVGVLDLAGPLRVGERICLRSPQSRLRSGLTADFDQVLESMQANNSPIEIAAGGQTIGIQLLGPVRVGDHVYVLDTE